MNDARDSGMASRQWWDGPLPGRLRDQAAVAESQETVLRDFIDRFDLRGADVLEVGGNLTSSAAGIPDHRSWLAVDPLAQDFRGDRCEVIGKPVEDAGLQRESVDLVISCNAFEHMTNLVESMTAIRDALRPGGYIYAHYGPIWSGPDGHHLENVSWEGHKLIFWRDNPIPHWTHLLLEPDEMAEMLEEHFPAELVQRIIHSVYSDDWINRRFFEDYFDAFREAGLSLVSFEGQHVVDYETKYPQGGYRHGSLAKLTARDPEVVLSHRFGPRYRNFRCRDMRVVLRRPKTCE